MITDPLFHIFATESARSGEDDIARFSTWTSVLPMLSVFTGRDDRFSTTLRNSDMAELDVVGSVTPDGGDAFVLSNLVKLAQQHRRAAGGVVSYFDSPYFLRARINIALLKTVNSPQCWKPDNSIAKGHRRWDKQNTAALKKSVLRRLKHGGL